MRRRLPYDSISEINLAAQLRRALFTSEKVFSEAGLDLDFTIEGLPTGAPVQIAVSASNNGGESARGNVGLHDPIKDRDET